MPSYRLKEESTAIRSHFPDGAITALHDSESFSEANARFLADQDRIADLSRYVIAQRERINGDQWYGLKGLAHRLRNEGHAPAARVIYRALLDSILNRGRSPAYQHGVRYLRHLDQLADEIENRGDMPPHADYFEALRKQHSRKWSFWGIYDGDNTGWTLPRAMSLAVALCPAGR